MHRAGRSRAVLLEAHRRDVERAARRARTLQLARVRLPESAERAPNHTGDWHCAVDRDATPGRRDLVFSCSKTRLESWF